MRPHDRFNLYHVESWDTFRNADDQINFRFNSLEDGIRGERRWHIDDRSFCFSFLLSLSNSSKDGDAEMLRTSLACVNSSNNFSAVGE